VQGNRHAKEVKAVNSCVEQFGAYAEDLHSVGFGSGLANWWEHLPVPMRMAPSPKVSMDVLTGANLQWSDVGPSVRLAQVG
jgi:hypothetical protein